MSCDYIQFDGLVEIKSQKIHSNSMFHLSLFCSLIRKWITCIHCFQDYITFVSIQDPTQDNPEGYNDKLSTSVWGKSGRVKVSK